MSIDFIEGVHRGQASAVAAVFESHRARFKRMVDAQLDPRLQSRLDPSDVVQEAGLAIHSRLPEFLAQQKLPVLLWMRLIVRDKIVDAHRTHLGAQVRDVRQEQSSLGAASGSAELGAYTMALVDTGTSPSAAAVRSESVARTMAALERLDAVDREIVYLRHFESMDSKETAGALGMTEAAVAKRYVRALAKIRERLGADREEEP